MMEEYTTNVINDANVLPAITHDNSMMLSPRYMGCLTIEYMKPVFISESIGVTEKLRPRENSDSMTVARPTVKRYDGILLIGCVASTILTMAMLHIIMPSQ
jgi:hypothetical protein